MSVGGCTSSDWIHHIIDLALDKLTCVYRFGYNSTSDKKEYIGYHDLRVTMKVLWLIVIVFVPWIHGLSACPEQCTCSTVKNRASEGELQGLKLICQPEEPITGIRELLLSKLTHDVIYM